MERASRIFGQILKFFPRTVFEAAVRQHEGDKHAKGMTCWSQFIALMLCHLGGVWPDEGLMTHSLHTVIIGRRGDLAANVEGNRFTAVQLGDLVKTTLNSPPAQTPAR